MEVVSVTLARVVILVSTDELNPSGKVPVLKIAAGLAEHYGFAKFPKTLDEWSAPSGAEFVAGQLGDIAISKATLFARGMVVETASSTEDSEKALNDMLTWGAETFGLLRPSPDRPRWYASELVFKSQMSLDSMHPVLRIVAEKVSASLANDPRRLAPYETTMIHWNFDDTNLKLPPGPFRIERRVGAPFSDNKWFSSAPLPTDQHIAILEECERALMSPMPRAAKPKKTATARRGKKPKKK